MRTINRILKKLRSDDGDGVLVLTIIYIPLAVILLGLVINVGHVVTNRAEYSAMAQNSAETAVKHINAKGSLTKTSVDAFVKEYQHQLTKDSSAWISDSCSTMEVNGVKRQLPYFEVRLGTQRGQNKEAKSEVFRIGPDGRIPDVELDSKATYRVISADVYTSTQSLFGGFGLQTCQLHHSPVSAIAFGSNRDLGHRR